MYILGIRTFVPLFLTQLGQKSINQIEINFDIDKLFDTMAKSSFASRNV